MTFDELKAMHAKMTPREWFADDESWCAYVLDEEGEPVYLFEVQGEAASNFEADLPGIVAMHNAFPALVERYEAMRVALDVAYGNMWPLDPNNHHSIKKCQEALAIVQNALAIAAKPLTESI